MQVFSLLYFLSHACSSSDLHSNHVVASSQSLLHSSQHPSTKQIGLTEPRQQKKKANAWKRAKFLWSQTKKKEKKKKERQIL